MTGIWSKVETRYFLFLSTFLVNMNWLYNYETWRLKHEHANENTNSRITDLRLKTDDN